MDKSSRATTICSIHGTEEVRFYCDDCKTLICDDCVVGYHSKHVKIKIKEYGDTIRQSIRTTASEALNTQLPEIEKLIDHAQNTKKSFNESTDKNIAEIRLQREVIKKIFDELQDELILNFEDARKAANDKFDEFSKWQTERCNTIKDITNSIQAKGSDISASEIAVYENELNKVLKNNIPEKVPKIAPPKYQYPENYVKKANLQHFFGHLDYGDYEYVPPADSLSIPETRKKYEETSSDFYEETSPEKRDENETKFEEKKQYQYDKILHIVPKQSSHQAWLVGNGIAELDLCNENAILTPLVSSLDTDVAAACRSRKHGLLIGFSGNKSIKRLQVSSGTFRKKVYKLVSYLNVDLNNVFAMCCPSSDADVTLCVRENILSGSTFFNNPSKTYTICWFSSSKEKIKEITVASEELENPFHICENPQGDICITCSPANGSSRVLLFDKEGKQKMQYPSTTKVHNPKIGEKTMLFSFLGAGFLSNGTITILDRVKYRQHLIDTSGEVLKIDSYDVEPTCMAVDLYDNIWVGFENGKIQIMNYNDRYETYAK